jgi:hypothetical protein
MGLIQGDGWARRGSERPRPGRAQGQHRPSAESRSTNVRACSTGHAHPGRPSKCYWAASIRSRVAVESIRLAANPSAGRSRPIDRRPSGSPNSGACPTGTRSGRAGAGSRRVAPGRTRAGDGRPPRRSRRRTRARARPRAARTTTSSRHPEVQIGSHELGSDQRIGEGRDSEERAKGEARACEAGSRRSKQRISSELCFELGAFCAF